jgi:hypothetical protein
MKTSKSIVAKAWINIFQNPEKNPKSDAVNRMT